MHDMYLKHSSHGYFGIVKDGGSSNPQYMGMHQSSYVEHEGFHKVGDYAIHFKSAKPDHQVNSSEGRYRGLGHSYGDNLRDKPYDYYGNSLPESYAEA